jgi:hypothetical protein
VVGRAVLCCVVYCCVDGSCVVARFVTAPLSCSSCQQRQRTRYPTMSLACCHTSAPQMFYSCGCVASSAHHVFRLCSHGYLLQDSEEACHQARSRTDVGALMESVRLQRKQLLLWDDALHSLQVLSPAGPFFLLRLLLFVLRPFPSSPEATLFTRLLLSCRCSGTRRNVLRTAAARCRRRCTRLF